MKDPFREEQITLGLLSARIDVAVSHCRGVNLSIKETRAIKIFIDAGNSFDEYRNSPDVSEAS